MARYLATFLTIFAATLAVANPKPQINSSYGKLPLIFEKNQGQTDSRVDFLARGAGYTLFLTSREAVLRLRGKQPSAIRMKVVGANSSAKAEGGRELPGRSNYFIGPDRSKWHTDVPHFSEVRYQNVYPGIDLVYYGKQRQLGRQRIAYRQPGLFVVECRCRNKTTANPPVLTSFGQGRSEEAVPTL